jgi:hypothetical protein
MGRTQSDGDVREQSAEDNMLTGKEVLSASLREHHSCLIFARPQVQILLLETNDYD